MNMEWMAWTLPTAVFFIVIAAMLAGMTVWQIVSPSVLRKGFLPISTNRGDRLFIGLLGSGYIHLVWMAVTGWSIWGALGISVIFLIFMMRYG
jgi:predicted small integral membrane protein